MAFLFHLHVDLFAGVPGKLFLGCMGLLLLVAIVSGVVLYAPFMRKLEFGAVRNGRTARLKWLDLHNLLGIVTLVWALVVGATGVVNTLADVLLQVLAGDRDRGHGETVRRPAAAGHAGIDGAVGARAQRAAAGHARRLHRLPGHAVRQLPPLRHLHARRPGAHRAPVQAGAGRCRQRPGDRPAHAALVPDALLLSQPLHFGDYGGAGMQFLWALLDLATIVVLGSGLYLWLKRGRAAARAARARAAGARRWRRSCDERPSQPVGHAGPAGRADRRDRPGRRAAGRWLVGPGVGGRSLGIGLAAMRGRDWHLVKPACIRRL
jgi:uncharacterized iron-regulated membrane protein